MSIKGPNPSSPDFNISPKARLFLRQKVDAFRNDLICKKPEQSEKIKDIFRCALSNLNATLAHVKSEEAFTELTQQQISSIKFALDQIKSSGDSLDLSPLRDSFGTCEKIAEKDREIRAQELAPFIGEPWLEEFLDWSLEKVPVYLEKFFLNNQDHPVIQKVIAKALEKDSNLNSKEKSNKAIYLLIFLSKDSKSSWARSFLIESLEKNLCTGQNLKLMEIE